LKISLAKESILLLTRATTKASAAKVAARKAVRNHARVMNNVDLLESNEPCVCTSQLQKPPEPVEEKACKSKANHTHTINKTMEKTMPTTVKEM